MRSPLVHRLKRLSAWLAIGALGALAGWWRSESAEEERRHEFIGRARLAAVALAEADLVRLTGTQADLTTPGYQALKERLRQLKAVDPLVRFVYVFRVGPPGGKVTYLGDSAEPGAKDESLPGDDYPQAPNSPGLQAIIRTGQAATEGPLADDFGTWVTAYAAIGSWRTGENGPATPRHVLGFDVDAADWRRAAWKEGLVLAAFCWGVCGVPLAVWFVNRRQREQKDVIRNLSGAVEQAHSAMMILDREGRIEYGNRALGRQLGYTRRELIGRPWRDFVTGSGAADVTAEIDGSLQAGSAWEGGWLCLRKDGTSIPVRGGFTSVKRSDGGTACFVALFDDVSEEKRREAELREATEAAQAADRAKGQFLATMSHEVRTPLNGIVGFTSLLLDTALSAEQREYVQTIRVSTEALVQLTADILDFARIDSGKVKLESVPCDPRECVEDTLDLHAVRAREKGIELLHRIDPAVPASVLVDGGRLRQVLVNLLSNALKFTERGVVEVTVTLGSAAGLPETERLLVFAVRDTGIGIPEDQHDRLFRAFSQLDETTTRRHGGVGLGLAICRDLVELMGGKISVQSRPGEGSTFTFSIRVTEVQPPPPAPDLQGAPVALFGPAGPLRDELADLLRSWRAGVTVVEPGMAPPAGGWPLAVVDVSEDRAQQLAEQGAAEVEWGPARAIGLVPIAASNELRAALRRHFRLLVNKPVHHGAFLARLLGASARPGEERAPAGAAGSARRFGFRVLVAEDNAVNQRLIKRVLENFGCKPALVNNGREAVDTLAARAADFDLVLLDMHMPEMDGIAALQAIRGGQAGPAVRDIWIIALSADAREQQRAQAMATGLNDYLTKPLNFQELAGALQRFGEARRERGA